MRTVWQKGNTATQSGASVCVTIDPVTRPPQQVWLRLGLFLLLLLSGAAVLLLVPVDADRVRAAVDDAGAWAWLAFVVGYVMATLLPLPKNLLSAMAGVVFGAASGTVLVWVAAVLGASTGFWLGRLLGRDGVRRLVGRHLDRLDRLVEHRGAVAVLVARLVPVVPFTAVNYGSGLTAVRFWPYLLATGVGILPGTVAYVVLGAYGAEPGSWPFLASVGALAVLAGAGLVLARRRRHAGV